MFNTIKSGSFGTDKFWKRTAVVAGIFALLICVLLVANYVQFKKADPVNMQVINTLVDRLYDNPADSTLRNEIRTLDLLSRKAYFTTKWQIRTGGSLLLAAVALIIISFQIISYRAKINPTISDNDNDNNVAYRKKARVLIISWGGAILAVSVVFAVLSTNELSDKFVSLGNVAENEVTAGSINAGEILPAGDKTDSSAVVPSASETTSTAVSDAPVSGLPPAIADNYPTFRGQGGTGIAGQKNIPVNWDGATGSHILWKTAVPLPGFCSPVIWSDKVFLTGADTSKNEVYCFDRNTGKILWTVAVPDNPGSPGSAPKINPETGYAASTAAVDENGVYAIFPIGDIIAIDITGKIIWSQNLGVPKNYYGHASSLMLYKGTIIVQYDEQTSPRIMALSTKTGKVVWSTPRPVKVSWSSPVIANTGSRTEIILVAEPYMAGYDANNGQELWKVDCITGEVGPSPAYANGIAFSVNEYSQLAAVKLGAQPAILWQNSDYLSDIPSPVATDKYLFLATSYGILLCYDAVTGEKYWENEIGNNIYASPVVVDGKLYLLDRTGIMNIIKTDKVFSLIGKPVLGERSSCTPAFTNGRIYIRGDKNLYCIGE